MLVLVVEVDWLDHSGPTLGCLRPGVLRATAQVACCLEWRRRRGAFQPQEPLLPLQGAWPRDSLDLHWVCRGPQRINIGGDKNSYRLDPRCLGKNSRVWRWIPPVVPSSSFEVRVPSLAPRNKANTAMSSLKRKAAPGGAPRAKAAKTSKDGKPSKRIDRARDSRKHAATAQDDDEELSGKLSGPPAEPIITRTRDEEPMFPRGGGSILTPLEKKQIHIQAKADALREDELEEEGKTKAKAKKQKKLAAAKKPGKGSKKPEAPAKEPSVKIESLSFKVSATEVSLA